MTRSRWHIGVALAVPWVGASPLMAQRLAQRVEGASGGAVQFHFAARPGICGDGRTYVFVDDDHWIGSFNQATRLSACEAGPVRVTLVRADRTLIRIDTYAGPIRPDSAATDLGRVSAPEAAAYLMSIASRDEGRAARDALLPALLADSARIATDLVALVRNETRPREVRRSALNWLARRRSGTDAVPTAELVSLAVALATDEQEHQSVRQSAVGTLGRLPGGEGIPRLIELARGDSWVAREAVGVLGRSGDPRARAAVREMVSNPSTYSEVRLKAIAALTGEYSTPKDAETLIAAYPTLTSDRARDGAINAVGSIGGLQARTWLLSLVRDRDQAMSQRKRAAGLLDNVGLSTAELTKLYDDVNDADVRSTLIDQLAQLATRDATTKLLEIANTDANQVLRRRAVQALSRFDEPRVKDALRGLVVR